MCKNGEDRLRELILYIADKCADDSTFGSVKLNKLLFAADVLAYRKRGRPVTGVEYMKLREGPAPRRLVPVREEMIGDGELVLQKRDYYGYEQKRPIPLREADISCFAAEEIADVSEVIRQFWGVDAKATSQWSHEALAWQVADNREAIPIGVTIVSDREPTAYEIERGKQLAAEHGWPI